MSGLGNRGCRKQKAKNRQKDKLLREEEDELSGGTMRSQS